MSHLDEGTLHALLDGELDLHEVREIQAHLGSCTACDSRFQAAKDVYGESDRLVASVQFPGALKGMQGQEAPRAAAAPAPAPAVPPGAKQRRIEAKPVTNVGVPQVVILPEQNEWPERRRRWMAAAKWAAVLFVAVGAGFLASEARKNSEPVGSPAMRAADTDEPNWVVSRDEMTEAESLSMAETTADKAANTAPVKPTTPAPKKPEAQGCAGRGPRRRHRPRARLAKAVSEEERSDAPPAEADELAETVQSQEDIRAEAAEALAQLDAQRRRERAAAATAALDRARRDAPRQAAAAGALQQVAAPPPPPPTLEQRSAIYLRIGLDEAARQLGRPVHVIEGLGAQFMGLVQGSRSPGADDDRPVVRVVYQDTQGRMILLDQQRIRPGQTWPSECDAVGRWGRSGWRCTEKCGGEALRNLRPRVR